MAEKAMQGMGHQELVLAESRDWGSEKCQSDNDIPTGRGETCRMDRGRWVEDSRFSVPGCYLVP